MPMNFGFGACCFSLAKDVGFKWRLYTPCIHGLRYSYPRTRSHFLVSSALRAGPSRCSTSSVIRYSALLLVISCAQYGTVSYRFGVEIRKIDVEIFHCIMYCAMGIESTSLVKILERQ